MKGTSRTLPLLVAIWFAWTAHAADALETWRWRNPLPQGHSLHAAVFGNGAFVAVGEFGTVLTTRDNGLSWAIEDSGSAEELRGIAFGNGSFIAVGGGSFSPTILVSNDGSKWVKREGIDAFALRDVAFGNGTFVAVGDTGSLLSSTDTVRWSKRGLYFESFHGVAFGNGTFVAVGSSGGILTSPDGANWTRRTSPVTSVLFGVAFGNGAFTAVGESGVILTSSDGTTWTRRTSGTTLALRHALRAAGIWIAVGDAGTVLVSPDGTTWSKRNIPTAQDLGSVASGNGTILGVGALGTILSSPDGSVWTPRDAGPRDSLLSVTFGNGQFVAVGESGAIQISANGRDWTSAVSGTANTLRSVGFGVATYVAVGKAGTILTSRDGKSWSKAASGTTADLWGVGYGNGTFIAVGTFTSILSSRDGIAWTKSVTGGAYDLRAVAYGNNTFVAVGEKVLISQVNQFLFGPIVSSTDGVTWTDRPAAKTALSGLAFGNGQFLALGNSIRLLSTDGAVWTGLTPPPLGQWQAVAYGNGAFVAVGASGALATSADGKTWSARKSGTGRGLSSVASDANSFVAVGDFGTILQTDRSSTPPTTNVTFAVTPSAITNDYTGKVVFDIGGLAPGQSIAIEWYLDENGNRQLDADEPLLGSFPITDGLAPAIGGVRNANVLGDEDRATNGAAHVEWDFSRRTETEGVASGDILKVASAAAGFRPVMTPFTIAPRSYPQSVSGTVTSSVTKAPVSGALVVLFDISSGVLGASGYTDTAGRFNIQSPPGKYVLLGLRRGFVGNVEAAIQEGELGPALLEVAPNQTLRHDFTLTPGGPSISGKVLDQTTGVGIPGLLVTASSISTNLGLIFTFGISDVAGNVVIPTTPGAWTVALQSKMLARLGYLNPGPLSDIDTTVGNVSGAIQLPRATALIYGSVRNEKGAPLGGINVSASEANSGLTTVTTTDSAGNYTLGVTEGTWDVTFEREELTDLGYDATSLTVRAVRAQAVRQDFTLKQLIGFGVPVITGFSPTSGTYGEYVVITGTNFTATTQIVFGGEPMLSGFSVDSPTQITTYVPEGARTGLIQVITPRGSVTSTNSFTIQLIPPAIQVHPESQTVFPGATVELRVTRRGTPPFSYQWLRNGTAIVGAELPTLQLSNVQLINAGAYSVIVSNVAGRAVSSNAVLTVQTALSRDFPAPWAVSGDGSEESYFYSVATDKAWNTYVTGAFTGTALIGGQVLTNRGRWDVLLAKFDVAGKRVWAAQAGGTGDDKAWSVALDGNDNCYVAGTFQFVARFGHVTLTNAAGLGLFIAKYSGDGQLLWAKQVGSAPSAMAGGLAADVAGNRLVVIEGKAPTSRFYRLRRAP